MQILINLSLDYIIFFMLVKISIGLEINNYVIYQKFQFQAFVFLNYAKKEEDNFLDQIINSIRMT